MKHWRAILLVVLGAFAGVTTLVIPACTGHQAAIKEAKENESLSDLAFVVASSYTLMVKQAVELKDNSQTPQEVVDGMREAEAAATPVVKDLREAASAYDGAKNAQTQAELEAAMAKAAPLIAKLARAIQKATGGGD